MALLFGNPMSLLLLLLAALFSLSLIHPCSSFNPKLLYNVSKTDGWTDAIATWYGDATGAGTDGGACGYKGTVSSAPFNSMVTAISDNIYKKGEGCGTCFQVKCLATVNKLCSETAITVTVADECPGGCSTDGSSHFDLSGTSFGALAISGQAAGLRSAGKINVQYQEVSCDYKNTKLTFTPDAGANNYAPAILIEYQAGKGEIVSVKLTTASGDGCAMTRSWGNTWHCNSSVELKAPYTLLVTEASGNTITAENVIPAGWKPSTSYTSGVNFGT